MLHWERQGISVTRGVPAAHVTVQGACEMAACDVALIMLCCRININVDNSLQTKVSQVRTFYASSYGWGAMSKYWSKLRCLKRGWVTLSTNFRGRGSSTNEFWRQKTKVPGLSRGVVCVMLCLAVLIHTGVWHTHKHGERERDTRSWLLPAQS